MKRTEGEGNKTKGSQRNKSNNNFADFERKMWKSMFSQLKI